ncbi:uncharacterized protein LOC134268811 [Saccostrea cucullata]|uniref:uncharacterized protein LOC134268811 n=1 Tax=Saccostrea cuccullata TaxID=36930 RepID=UPI002ED3DCA9
MHGITNSCMVLLCTFLKAESLLFHGQTNVTSSVSSGHSDPEVYKQLLNLERDLISIMRDQKQQAQKFEQKQTLLEGEIQSLRQWNQTAQMKISLLESENKNLKERLENMNSSSTFLKQNVTTSEDLRKLENILTFEIEQTVRDIEEKIMKNMSTTITDLELRDRYLSLSLLDVHSNMTILDHALSKLKQQQMTNEKQQNITIQKLSLSVLDVHNNTAELSSSLSSLDAQQKQMKSEIQTVTNSQQKDITKLNDTIIHLKNRMFNCFKQFKLLQLQNVGQTYASEDTVIFPTVIYQAGGGYNPTTGVFTAPKAGLYLISVPMWQITINPSGHK